MQLETLREFIAVARHGSYTSAAKALYLSQPAISKHIAALEKSVGQKLFFDTQPLILTEAGRVVMEYASKMISQTETMEIRLEHLKKQEFELIRLQDLTFFEALREEAQNLKNKIRKDFPGATFSIVRCKPDQTPIESLFDNHIDIGFLFNITDRPDPLPPGNNDMGEYCALPMIGYTGEFRLGVPKHSPLLEKEDLRLSDFADQKFFAMATNLYDSFVRDFRDICLEEGFSPQIEFVTTNSNQDFWTRNYGDGILLLDVTSHKNFTTADDYLSQAYVPVRPFGDKKTLYVTITMVTRNEAHGPAFSYFLEAASNIVQSRAEIAQANAAEVS